jgi:hypothetical protein
MSLYSKLFLRTKTSPYGDFTRNSVLSFDDLDQNFLFLKERDIQSFSISGTVLNYNTTGGDIYSIDLDSIVDSAANVVWKTGSTGNFSIKAINDSGLDATGNYSVAEGFGTTASGLYSHAEGQQTTSSNDASHAEGYRTEASGPYSHAEGELSIASGTNSHAEGDGTSASASASHAEGSSSIASGNYSHAEGQQTKATGTTTHAEGYRTIAGGDYSHAEGANNIALGEASHAEGGFPGKGWFNIASGPGSHAEGASNTASGDMSHAEGFENTALGNFSHAEGNATNAFGGSAHAEGIATSATTDASHAEGYQTTASGNYSHAEGYQNIASGEASHAEGYGGKGAVISSGLGSHAEGAGTTASGDASHAEGIYTVASADYTHAGGASSTASGANSFIHSTNSLVTGARSAVLGGQNITGATDDTVYVPYLNIGLANGGTPIAGLSLDANNNVITGATGLSSGSCISDLYVTNIHGCSPVTIKDDLIVEGDLTILGSATTVDIKSEEVHIADNFILLNSNVSGGTPTQDSGIDVRRGDQPNGRILWNETDDRWEVGTSGTTYEVITTNNIGSFTGNTLQNVLDNGSTAVGIATDVSINKTGSTHDTTWSLTDNDGGISQTDGTWTGTNKVETSSLSYLQLTNGTITSQMAASKTEVKMDWTDTGGNNILAINSTSNTFTDGINSKGLEYASDYSSNFTNESLVTKRYVTGITSTLDNFYVTGFTYDDVNTFTLSRNGGLGNLTSTISVLSGITYYGDGSNLSGISTDNFYVTGGTYNSSTDTITLNRNDNQSVDITGVTDTFTTGATYDNGTATATFTKNDDTTYTLDLSTIDVNDTFVTGFTYDDVNTFTLERNGGLGNLTSTISVLSGITYYGDGSNLSGISTDNFYVTGGTLTDGTLTLERNDNQSFDITGFTEGCEVIVTNVGSGNSQLYSLPLSANTGAFFDYVVSGSTGVRSGSLTTVFSGTSANIADLSTDDIGDTTDVSFNVTIAGGEANLNVSAVTGTWRIEFTPTKCDVTSTVNGGEINTGTNIGGGEGLFSSKSGVELEFKTLTSTGGTVTITSTGDTVNLESSGGGGGSGIVYIASGTTQANLLDDTNNWDINGEYTGTSITGTLQGYAYYNSDYWFTAVDDNDWIRLIRG